MDSSASPVPSAISDIFEGGKKNFAKSFELSIKKANQLFLNVSRNVQTLKNGNAAAPYPPSEVDGRGQPAQTMAEPSTFKEVSAEEEAAAAAVSGRANVSALMLKTSGGGTVGTRKPTSAAASPISLSSSSSLSPSGSYPSPAQNSSSSSSSSAEDEIPYPHFDLSTVSATSVFDIGSIGTPVLGPELGNPERGGTVVDDVVWNAAVAPPSRSESESSSLHVQQQQQPPPLVELDDVRKFVGNAVLVWRKVRALGLRESSWENKMPWRHPRPACLAKGLQWPPEEFSSEKEKHEYYRRARRRGRYLIGPTPTWSFIVADLALLYFLIDNPAGKFLL